MRYIVCKKVEDFNVPLLDKQNNVIMFDNDFDANIERIYLQPDYDELLKVVPTNIGE